MNMYLAEENGCTQNAVKGNFLESSQLKNRGG
jgi:hypothetical protein